MKQSTPVASFYCFLSWQEKKWKTFTPTSHQRVGWCPWFSWKTSLLEDWTCCITEQRGKHPGLKSRRLCRPLLTRVTDLLLLVLFSKKKAHSGLHSQKVIVLLGFIIQSYTRLILYKETYHYLRSFIQENEEITFTRWHNDYFVSKSTSVDLRVMWGSSLNSFSTPPLFIFFVPIFVLFSYAFYVHLIIFVYVILDSLHIHVFVLHLLCFTSKSQWDKYRDGSGIEEQKEYKS